MKGIKFFLQEKDQQIKNFTLTTDPIWTTFIETLENNPWKEKSDLKITPKSFRQTNEALQKEFASLETLVQLFDFHHRNWQIDTIIISFLRGDDYTQICSAIRTKHTVPCFLCKSRKHHTNLCPKNTELLQQQRIKASINLRKDNLNGPYSQRSPFHLLTQTLIPEAVFQAYEQNFIPFYPGNNFHGKTYCYKPSPDQCIQTHETIQSK